MEHGIIDFLENELELKSLPPNLQKKFWISITRYVTHSKKDKEFGGRTLDFIKSKVEELTHILDIIGYTKKEIVTIISNEVTLLNNPNIFYQKYLILGLVENDNNTFRKNRFINNEKDLRISIEKMLKRYLIICESDYQRFTWNSLVHSTDNEFLTVFVRTTYKKPYQIFETYEEAEEYYNKLDVSNIDLEIFKRLTVNKELVEQYEGITIKN